MADHLNRYLTPAEPVQANQVLFANGVSTLCSMLSFLVGEPGDGVLLGRPIYGKFENDWGIEVGYGST
jgi:1-aminocyclopropane-1-carboxylate synthase